MAQPTQTRTWYRSARTVTGWTILFMVLLRVAIGWHFFYEGWWKLTSGGQFSSTPYLMASVGPFKDVFHWMVDDMDGTKKRMTRDFLHAKLDERFETIRKHYDKLTPEQLESLKAFVERKKHGVVDEKTVANLFDRVIWAGQQGRETPITSEQDAKALFIKHVSNAGEYVDPKAPGKTDQLTIETVIPRPEKRAEIIKEIEALIADLDKNVQAALKDPLVAKGKPAGQEKKLLEPAPPVTIVPPNTAPDDVRWITRGYVEKLISDRYDVLRKHYGLTEWQHQSKYGWRYRDQKIRGHHDKNNVDYILADPDFQKALEDYKALLEQIDKEEQTGNIQYDHERTAFNITKKAKLRDALLARVEAPLGDVDLQKIQGFQEYLGPIKDVTPEQLSAGPLPAPRELQFPGNLIKKMGFELPKQTLTYWEDIGMMFGLTIVGLCLILGLFTRLAAFGGVCMLAMFYLAMPPFPGVEVPPGSAEGHYLYVNKNLIEAIALLMIMFSGVGRWFGVDALIHAIFGRREPEIVEATAPAGRTGADQGRVYIPEPRSRESSRA